MSVSKIPEKVYLEYITGKSSIIKFIFGKLFGVLLSIALILVVCFRRELSFFCVGIICYKAFLLGVTSAIVIKLFNVAGVLNVLLLLPVVVLMVFLLCSWAILCMRYCLESRAYGGSVFSREFWCTNRRAILVISLCTCLLILLESLLMPLLSTTLIVPKWIN